MKPSGIARFILMSLVEGIDNMAGHDDKLRRIREQGTLDKQNGVITDAILIPLKAAALLQDQADYRAMWEAARDHLPIPRFF
jgi:hypothetical protein